MTVTLGDTMIPQEVNISGFSWFLSSLITTHQSFSILLQRRIESYIYIHVPFSWGCHISFPGAWNLMVSSTCLMIFVWVFGHVWICWERERGRERDSCVWIPCSLMPSLPFWAQVSFPLTDIARPRIPSRNRNKWARLKILHLKISHNHKHHVVGTAVQVSVWHFSATPISPKHPDIESTDPYIGIASQAALLERRPSLHGKQWTQRATARQVPGSPGEAQRSAGSQQYATPDFQHFSVHLLGFLPVALILQIPGKIGMSSESKVKFPEQSGDCPRGGSQEMHRKVLTSSTFLCISSASCQLPWSCRFQEKSECLPRARLSFRNNLAIVLGEEVRRSTEKCWKPAVRDSWLPALFCASPRLPASCLDLASSRNTEESDGHFANHWVGPTVLEDSGLQSTSCKQNLQRSGIETMKTQTCCDLVRVLHRCWYRWMWPVAWKGWKRAAAVCSSPTRKGMVSKLPSPQQQPGTWSYYWKSRASMPRGCGRNSLISRRTRWHGDSCQTGRKPEPSWPKRIGRIGTRSWEATSVQERLPRLHQRHRYVSNATDSDSSAWKKSSQQQEVCERQWK